MSQAIVDGLREVGARRIAVATAYADDVNNRLAISSRRTVSRCWRCAGSALSDSAIPARRAKPTSSRSAATSAREAAGAEGLLISCGGLRTLGVAKPIEEGLGIPVVSSTQAAFWAAMRLAGASGHVAGRGRLLEDAALAPAN